MAAIYGQLVKAQLENLGSDPGTTPTGIMWLNTGTSLAKFYDGAATRVIVSRDLAETLTNKTLTSPVLTTPNIDDYVDVNEESAPSTPSSGKIRVYGKTDKKLYRKGSDGIEFELGAGSGVGEINYVTNSDAESGVASVAAYQDAAASSPVDGTGGTANVTVTRNTSSPLRGNADFSLAKDAADRQGQGWSWDLGSVSLADRSKKLKIQFDYNFTDSNYATGDVKVFIYDITNTTLITPQNNSVAKGSGTHVATFDATTSSSYRLILHVATTNSSAYTLKVDNVIVGPGLVAKGAAVSPWYSYSLTIGATTTAPTKGTIVLDAARWRRVGDSMEVRYDYRQTSAGSAGSGSYLFPLPSGYTIDTTKLTPSTNRLESPVVGHGIEFADNGAGGTVHTASARAYNTTNIWMCDEGVATSSDAGMQWSSSDNGRLSLAGMTYSLRFTVPITEWRDSGTLNVLQEDNLTTWTSFTPTWVGGNAATVTPTNYRAKYRRVGQELEISYSGYFSSIGSATGRMLLTLPNSWTMDTTSPEYVGSGSLGTVTVTNGSNTYIGTGVIESSTQIRFDTTYNVSDSSGSRITPFLVTYPTLNSDIITFKICVPIVQFQNSGSSAVGFSEATAANLGLLKKPDSEIVLYTGNGLGSVGTRIRRFSTVGTNTGTGMTLTQSSSNGDSITINTAGVYAITYIDRTNSNAQGYFGISKNAGNLAQDIDALAAAQPSQVLGFTRTGAATSSANQGDGPSLTIVCRLAANDVIRAHGDTGQDNTVTGFTRLHITQLAVL